MSGDVHVRFCERLGVRFPRATHLVMVFGREDDARRVLEVLPKRFGKYGLTLHPEKTRLVAFRRPSGPRPPKGGTTGTGPGNFYLLGFTHYWARARRGFWVVKQKTSKKRLSRAIQRVARWCREHRHLPVREQHKALARKLRGHCEYYGITGNSLALGRFRKGLLCAWRKWLDRRSYHAGMTWERFGRLLERYPIPPATAVHSLFRHAAKP